MFQTKILRRFVRTEHLTEVPGCHDDFPGVNPFKPPKELASPGLPHFLLAPWPPPRTKQVVLSSSSPFSFLFFF